MTYREIATGLIEELQQSQKHLDDQLKKLDRLLIVLNRDGLLDAAADIATLPTLLLH